MLGSISRRTRNIVAATALGLTLSGGFVAGQIYAVEAQPHMRSALDALRTARRQLAVATDDKGGHRAKALALVDEAIEQVQKGIGYDDRH